MHTSFFRTRSGDPLSFHSDNLRFLNQKLKDFELPTPMAPTLLAGEQLAHHARALALKQKISFTKRTVHAFPRYLRRTYAHLNEDYLILAKSLQNPATSLSGSEWIVDNFYLLEEHVQSCNNLFSSLRQRNLPILVSGKFAGQPRIYELARELFDHTDSLVSEKDIDIFIEAFQEIATLTLQELEAFPHFLDLALFENLHVFAEINATLYKQQQAAAKFKATIGRSHWHKKLANQSVGTIINLMQSLKEAEPSSIACLQLIGDKCSCDALVAHVLHVKSAYQISISNIFASLRNLTHLHWHNWLERHSQVHALLQIEPTHIYSSSEFPTRALCRHAIQRLSAHDSSREVEITQLALAYATREGPLKKPNAAKFHSVVYYLIDDGVVSFESALKYKVPTALKISRWVKHNMIKICFVSFLMSIAIALAVPFFYQYWMGSGLGTVAFLITLFLILASEVAMQGLQWLAAQYARPTLLPTLDCEKGIPAEHRTLVCVHVQLSDRNHIIRSIKNLKISAIANADKNIFFALVIDCQPANVKEHANEQPLIGYAAQLVERLNKKSSRFFLLFRHRSFSSSEKQFIGWERKRGKLHQLNSIITGDDAGEMRIEAGEQSLFQTMRYVLTLDEDTRLPPGAATKLIQTIAHPLNQAIIDPETKVVSEGYGIIQPKISTSLKSAARSRFANLFAHLPGLEAYAHAVSNAYQDLFNEGSYIGKAIYDVRVFEGALKDRFPDEHVLSHDLLEGLFARVGLVSNIELLDEFPKNYISYYRRLHRWIRGDWQLLPWLGKTIPTGHGTKVPTPISPLGRFKIFDNLRRSLIEPAAFFAFVASITVLPGSPIFWMLLVFFGINFSLLISLVERSFLFLVRPVEERHFASDEKLATIVLRALVHLSFLPMQAYVILHAIVQTLYRLLFSRKHLLEWTAAADVDRKTDVSLVSFIKNMLPGTVLSLISILCVALFFPNNLLYAGPMLALWIFSPLIAYALAKPIKEKPIILSNSQYKKLLGIAYDTLQYFSEFATPATNFLAPDNVQMVPSTKLALRTSPTNIGFQLQSIISAHDLGAMFLPKVLSQINDIFATLAKMERCRGHLFNWYDITNLKPLSPRFVSTVDSGNLVVHLITLRSGLRQLCLGSIITQHHWRHIQFAVDQLAEITVVSPYRICAPKTLAELMKELDNLANIYEKAAASLGQHHGHLQYKVQRAVKLLAEVVEFRSYMQNNLPVDPSLAAVWESMQCKEMHFTIHTLVQQCTQMIDEMNVDFLYSKDEELLSIGYHVESDELDANFYNLLASEASLTSLVAVAKNEVPSKHWFALGRAMVGSQGSKTLLSWSGSAFEYLMPTLFYDLTINTLLAKCMENAVRAQQIHGQKQQLPWGESEAAYAATDAEGSYLYRAFGIAELGLKRDLAENNVVSPYSTFLAMHVDIAGALTNIELLEQEGARAKYGFYDAIDYTQSRLKEGERSYVVKSVFAHHQGMIICALNNLLCNKILRKRFHKSALICSVDLLLQERFPIFAQTVELPKRLPPPIGQPIIERSRSVRSAFTRLPSTHVLSNGTMSTMIDNAGSGFLFKGPDIALTNFTHDLVTNNDGYYIFIRDLDNNELWSVGFQPSRVKADRYSVVFHPERAIFHRKDFDIDLRAEITISPEHNAEIRKLVVTNQSAVVRNIEITTYAEIVLEQLSAFHAHPCFSKMFIESEYINDLNGLIFNRRNQAPNSAELFLMHALVGDESIEVDQWESSRARFLGVGNSINNPAAFRPGTRLSNTTGFTIDPILSLRTRIVVEASRSKHLSFVTGTASSRSECEALLRHYSSSHAVERAFAMSYARSEIDALHEQMSPHDVHAAQQFSKEIFFSLRKSAASQEATKCNTLHQSDLWRFGISGDLPIIYFRYSDRRQISVLKRLLSVFNFLRAKQVHFDLFVLNEFVEGYRRDMQDELQQYILSATSGQTQSNNSGKVVLMDSAQLSEQEITLLSAIAHRVITAHDQESFLLDDDFMAEQKPYFSKWQVNEHHTKSIDELEFFNGYGGFCENGKAYRIVSPPDKPWSNIVGTKDIGFLVTQKGGGYTWSDNSQTNCLTTRSEDPVIDPWSEMIFVQNAEDKSLFSPFGCDDLAVEHHFGFSSFKAKTKQLSSELTLTCSPAKRIKWFNLQLTNHTNDTQNLNIFFYLEWVLGDSRAKNASHLFCSYDKEAELLFVQNNYRDSFANRLAFMGANVPIGAFTSSREEFIGRYRDLTAPLLGMRDTISSGIDICGALKTTLTLEPNQTKSLIFYVGEAESLAEMKTLADYARCHLENDLHKTKTDWAALTSTIQVKTPDRAFDLMMNGWLLYQTLSCRLLARASFYQASGAFGFRDQLQDILALVLIDPQQAREHILLHASRQFVEGDVQHWWMPSTGKGVRTRCSDDYLWLPYALCRYLEITNDNSIVDERVHFIEGPILADKQVDAYFAPTTSRDAATIYEHCTRSIDRALVFGQHGLPLMRGGDWNDGMNRVGAEGKGESVWLAWFLSDILLRFSNVAMQHCDQERAERYLTIRNELLRNVEEHSWDGAWYRRAYFDDGTPLGSSVNEECQIDSIAQSWSVIAQGNDPARQRQAMESVFAHLVDEENHLIKLLTPPFDKCATDPGYIKAYPPGIRENGAQYTHAATWVILASALLGEGQKAYDLFTLINPVHLTSDEEGVKRYQAEPYVLAGDVYSVAPHTAEAGWSWYTGSSGWLWHIGIEAILGLKVRGNVFTIDPCVAPNWNEFGITYKINRLTYVISVKNFDGVERGVREIKVAGVLMKDNSVIIPSDSDQERTIEVEVVMG